MRKELRQIFLLFCLVSFAAILRFAFLADFPVGFTADEAAQGYTAYSILETGRDEWGTPFPLSPRSFGEFKLPLYTYLTIPSVAVFGLNEFAVRFPAAFFGTLAVLAVFLLVRKLFDNEFLAFFASFLLAVSPWHISLSRAALEANLTTFFLPLGFYLFLRGLTNKNFLSLAAVTFGLNLFTYHSARLITPLFVLFLIWWKRKELIGKDKKLFWQAFFIFICFLILTMVSLWQGGWTRAKDVGIQGGGFLIPKIFVDNYLSYFSLEFLFIRGTGDATYGVFPGFGMLHYIELPFLLSSAYFLIKKWEEKILPILAWLLLAPLAAALTMGVGYYTTRAAFMMPAIQIFSAYGGIVLWQYLKKYFPQKLLLLLYSSALFLCLSFFLWFYFFQAPKLYASKIGYGWRQTISYLSKIEGKYDKIVISRSFSEPQAFVAFYKKWDPADFQNYAREWLKIQPDMKFLDQLGNYRLGKYEFRSINWTAHEDRGLRNIVFVGTEGNFQSELNLNRWTVFYPDGKAAFFLVEKP